MARGDGVNRTSARNANLTAKSIVNAQRHNEREKESYVSGRKAGIEAVLAPVIVYSSVGVFNSVKARRHDLSLTITKYFSKLTSTT